MPGDLHGEPLPHDTGECTQRAEVPAGSGPRGTFAASDNQRPVGVSASFNGGWRPRCHLISNATYCKEAHPDVGHVLPAVQGK